MRLVTFYKELDSLDIDGVTGLRRMEGGRG